MKKRLIAVLAVLLTTCMLFTTLTGCGKDYVDDENTVVIDFFKGGYGIDFIKKMETEFEAANPGKDVKIKDTQLRNKVIDVLKSGPKANDADIVITNGGAAELLGKGKELGYGNEYIFEPLTDVFDYKEDGGKSLRDKFYSSYYPVTNFNDKEYSLIWSSGMQGLIYHADEFGNNQIPRTTNELLSSAQTFKSEGKIPFVYSGFVDYWNALHLTWWAQYQGRDEYFKFYQGLAKVEQPIGSGQYVEKLSPQIFLQDGRLKSLEVLNSLLNNSAGLCDPESTGLNFTDAQGRFINKKAVMHPNGDWLENESGAKEKNLNMKFMKTPVISELGTRLKITESELINTIDYVDGIKADKPTYSNTSVNQEETIARVKEARNMVYLSSTTHFAAIPSYSNAIPLAKEFLKFMFSSRGAEIFAESTGGATLPVEYDYPANTELYSKFSTFQKSRIEIMNEDAVGIYQDGSHPIVYRGLLKPYSYNAGVIESAFGATNDKDRKTPSQIIQTDVEAYNATGWQALLKRSGYIK